ncbi:MAG: helix-turn-helix protein [Planctomycetota bacterium]
MRAVCWRGRPCAARFRCLLAAEAGISQGYLSQLEQDEREPTLSIAARLATALGVSLDELATGAA